MLSAEQIKKLIASNESLAVQLADANAILAAREQEIDYLNKELSAQAALRSTLDGQRDEIEGMQDKLAQKQQAAKGAREREAELQHELGQMALLNKQYNELLQDYAYLQSQYKDVLTQMMEMKESKLELEKATSRIAELESKLTISLQEAAGLKEKLWKLENRVL